MPHALHFLVLTVAGGVNRHQDDLIDFSERRIASSASNLVPDRFASQTPAVSDSTGAH